ncbi:MAG UNVERIFIED_CONTAM: hypothetical protein LVT10_03160 [Anaerolineae bacterium]
MGGAGDQPAGGIGNGIVRPNQVSLTVGTSGVAYASSAHYSPELNGRLHTFCGPVPSTWFHMGVMLSAAGGMRWFSDEIAQGMSVEAINQAVVNVPTGSRGLLFAPYLSGEAQPPPRPTRSRGVRRVNDSTWVARDGTRRHGRSELWDA